MSKNGTRWKKLLPLAYIIDSSVHKLCPTENSYDVTDGTFFDCILQAGIHNMCMYYIEPTFLKSRYENRLDVTICDCVLKASNLKMCVLHCGKIRAHLSYHTQNCRVCLKTLYDVIIYSSTWTEFNECIQIQVLAIWIYYTSDKIPWTFPQFIIPIGYFEQVVVWVFSDNSRTMWPPVQNIPLEAVHCGKATVSSLTTHTSYMVGDQTSIDITM